MTGKAQATPGIAALGTEAEDREPDLEDEPDDRAEQEVSMWGIL